MNILFVFEVLVELDDVWVIKFLQDLHFRFESLRVLEFRLGDRFHSSLLLGDQMFGLTYNTKSTATEGLFGDPVMLLKRFLIFDNEGRLFDQEIVYDCFHLLMLYLKFNFI